MGIEFLIKMLVSMLGEYLIVPAKAAKYAKWFIRARNYLNLLFPVERYPVDWKETNINPASAEKYAVPVNAVQMASQASGFKLPFINNK